MVFEPQVLRFFQARFEPLAPFPELAVDELPREPAGVA